MSDKPQNGILSKMVKYVTNPRTNWSELDNAESDKDTELNKAQLKELIERKRRNDFVRKREFDMLRKIRQREAMGGADGSARPSFFQSSMPSKPDDRAQTLKKIDEIEAQMSMQWWKTNVPQGAASNSTVGSSVPPGVQLGPGLGTNPNAYARTAPVGLGHQRTLTGAEAEAAEQASAESAPPTAAASAVAAGGAASAPSDATSTSLQRPRTSPVAVRAGALDGLAQSADDGGFSASKLFGLEVAEVDHDPELEEAAIRFANGDDASAEALLREAIGPTGGRARHEDTWLALFDYYRAVGDQNSFESQAIDFADRFGRSSPAWFSMPALVEKIKPIAAATNTNAAWSAPSTLGLQSVAAFKAALAKAAQPWHIDWGKVQNIERAAVEPLTAVLRAISSQAVTLNFHGVQALIDALAKYTPSGERGTEVVWWKLRMEALRLMHRPDDFELVALDYCVTYEVSPPSWESVQCSFKSMDSDSRFQGVTVVGDAFHDSMAASGHNNHFGDSRSHPPSQAHSMGRLELSGVLEGDASIALERIEQKLLGADVLVISCANLIRVDFSAAGTILNWVSSRQAEGRMVQFTDVHRLISPFFSVVGVSEHARISTRRD